MTAEVKPESTVTFTVKELLDEQTRLLRGIDRKVDGKADKSDLVPIITQLREHDGRLKTIEDDTRESKVVAAQRAMTRRRAWAVFASVVVPLAVALILVLL